MSRRGAANAANVSFTAFKNWLAWGREGTAPYVDFVARVEAAEAKAERTVVDALMVAVTEGKVPAIMFWLQQRRLADWGQKTAAEVEETQREETAEADLDVARSVVAALESRKAG